MTVHLYIYLFGLRLSIRLRLSAAAYVMVWQSFLLCNKNHNLKNCIRYICVSRFHVEKKWKTVRKRRESEIDGMGEWMSKQTDSSLRFHTFPWNHEILMREISYNWCHHQYDVSDCFPWFFSLHVVIFGAQLEDAVHTVCTPSMWCNLMVQNPFTGMNSQLHTWDHLKFPMYFLMSKH